MTVDYTICTGAEGLAVEAIEQMLDQFRSDLAYHQTEAARRETGIRNLNTELERRQQRLLDDNAGMGGLFADITIEIVPESLCPTCGAGDDHHNRPKVGDDDGTWWWRCYNAACPTEYYNPDTGGIE